MQYFIYFTIALALSVVFTLAVRKIALRTGITDKPGDERKIHKKPIPLLGGVAIFFSFFITLLLLAVLGDMFVRPKILNVYSSAILYKHLWGIFIASCVLLIGGILDDKYDLKPSRQIIFPILAVLIVIASGIGIKFITNPFGGVLYLDRVKFTLFTYEGLPYRISLFADLFTIIWMMGMMYTTKFLDGLDGLVGGISIIGAMVIFFLSIFLGQTQAAMISIIFAGAMAGFLIFNFNPASIFLGESGALFSGFMLGVLSIISGAKVATALLVMGIPIMDVVWVIVRRRIWEKRKASGADSKHLHFRLLRRGFSHRQAVLFMYALTATFGFSALLLQSKGKLMALGVLAMVMIILALGLVFGFKKHNHNNK